MINLEENLSKAVLGGADAVQIFFDSLKPYSNNKKELIDFALKTLEEFSKEQEYLVAANCREIIEELGNADILVNVNAIRNRLPALPGLRDYRIDFDELIALLTNRGNNGCDCQVRKNYNTAPYTSYYSIISSVQDPESYLMKYEVECTKCHAKFLVEKDDSYHYPTFNWR